MFTKMLCQSCAMPIKTPKDCGSNSDETPNQEYCFYCYKNGAFVEPNITLEQMIEKVTKMIKKMGVNQKNIERSKNTIPTLKRWKQK